jgi:hypothetical protein
LPYLQRYLIEHVGNTDPWDRLGQRIDVLDCLDADAIVAEAMRTGSKQVALPVPILATMIATTIFVPPSPRNADLSARYRRPASECTSPV